MMSYDWSTFELPPDGVYISIEEAKAKAPRLRESMENQFIVEVPGGYKILTGFGPMPNKIKRFNGYRVICSRSFEWTNYELDHQGLWSEPD